jgi:hypothetical protein
MRYKKKIFQKKFGEFSTKLLRFSSVGGDGLINEVVNGLMNREDKEHAIKIPIGIIPAGSQNALAVSGSGGSDPELHALAIIKGRKCNDLVPVLNLIV